MKNTLFHLTLGALLLLGSCAAMKESAKARAMLEKCTYSLSEVNLTMLDLAPTISFDNSKGKFNVEKPSKDIIKYRSEIKDNLYNVDLSQLTFNAMLQIENPNTKEVMLDSFYLDTYLDETFLVKIVHPDHTVIAANSTYSTPVDAQVPTAFPVKKLLTAENAVFKGKVWLRINLTKNTEVTLPIPVRLTREIPREEINAAIDAEKKEMTDKLIDYIKSKSIKDVKKGVKKLIDN